MIATFVRRCCPILLLCVAVLAIFASAGWPVFSLQDIEPSQATTLGQTSVLVDERGARLETLFDRQPKLPLSAATPGVRYAPIDCSKYAGSVIRIPVVMANYCTPSSCRGAFFYNDPQECCPGGGGTHAYYIGGGSDPYAGYRHTGGESCTAGGCPPQCTEEGRGSSGS